MINSCSTVKHNPTGEEWFLLGVNKQQDRVCVAGWPPTMAKLSDCTLIRESSRVLRDNEIEYRNREFGSDWE